jgi:hypothetical protein
MIIYIDDNLVYSKRAEKHVEHLKYVMNKLYENKPFANMAKGEFAHEEMDFLIIHQKMANMTRPMTMFVVVNTIHDYVIM